MRKPFTVLVTKVRHINVAVLPHDDDGTIEIDTSAKFSIYVFLDKTSEGITVLLVCGHGYGLDKAFNKIKTYLSDDANFPLSFLPDR
jgi:hypothetical protein